MNSFDSEPWTDGFDWGLMSPEALFSQGMVSDDGRNNLKPFEICGLVQQQQASQNITTSNVPKVSNSMRLADNDGESFRDSCALDMFAEDEWFFGNVCENFVDEHTKEIPSDRTFQECKDEHSFFNVKNVSMNSNTDQSQVHTDTATDALCMPWGVESIGEEVKSNSEQLLTDPHHLMDVCLPMDLSSESLSSMLDFFCDDQQMDQADQALDKNHLEQNEHNFELTPNINVGGSCHFSIDDEGSFFPEYFSSHQCSEINDCQMTEVNNDDASAVSQFATTSSSKSITTSDGVYNVSLHSYNCAVEKGKIMSPIHPLTTVTTDKSRKDKLNDSFDFSFAEKFLDQDEFCCQDVPLFANCSREEISHLIEELESKKHSSESSQVVWLQGTNHGKTGKRSLTLDHGLHSDVSCPDTTVEKELASYMRYPPYQVVVKVRKSKTNETGIDNAHRTNCHLPIAVKKRLEKYVPIQKKGTLGRPKRSEKLFFMIIKRDRNSQSRSGGKCSNSERKEATVSVSNNNKNLSTLQQNERNSVSEEMEDNELTFDEEKRLSLKKRRLVSTNRENSVSPDPSDNFFIDSEKDNIVQESNCLKKGVGLVMRTDKNDSSSNFLHRTEKNCSAHTQNNIFSIQKEYVRDCGVKGGITELTEGLIEKLDPSEKVDVNESVSLRKRTRMQFGRQKGDSVPIEGGSDWTEGFSETVETRKKTEESGPLDRFRANFDITDFEERNSLTSEICVTSNNETRIDFLRSGDRSKQAESFTDNGIATKIKDDAVSLAPEETSMQNEITGEPNKDEMFENKEDVAKVQQVTVQLGQASKKVNIATKQLNKLMVRDLLQMVAKEPPKTDLEQFYENRKNRLLILEKKRERLEKKKKEPKLC